MSAEGSKATTSSSVDKSKNKTRHCAISIVLLLLSIQAWFLEGIINEYSNYLNSKQPQIYSTNKWIEIRFWNISNPDEILLGAVPHVILMPPLVYNILEIKLNTTLSPDGEFISYDVYQFYLYNPKKSQLAPTEMLTIINPMISTVYYNYKNAYKYEDKYMWYQIMKEIDRDPNLLFIKETATDQLFATYKFDFDNITFEYGVLRNGSEYSISLNTGKIHSELNGQVRSYNHSTYTSCWDPAQPIYPGYYQDGPYGEHFITTWNPIYSFIPHSLHRTVELNYNRTVTYNNTNVWQYTFNINPQLMNTSIYPPNAQFSQYGPSGIFNLTTCFDNIQIFASLPFFYGATDYMRNNTKLGIPEPNPLYQPYILIENQTGNVYFANISLQYNSLIHSYPISNNYTHSNKSLQHIVNHMMVPMYQIAQIQELNNTVSHIGNGRDISSVSQEIILFISRLIAYVAIVFGIMYQIWMTTK